MVYVAQQRLDGYKVIVKHVVSRKGTFDCWVLAKKTGQVIFKHGQLIQIYRSNIDYSFKTEWKLLPKWSQPWQIVKWLQNSYMLENLDSSAIGGTFSSEQLQEFISREGTKLVAEQQELEKKLGKEDSDNEGMSEGEDEEEDTERGIEDRFEGGEEGAEAEVQGGY